MAKKKSEQVEKEPIETERTGNVVSELPEDQESGIALEKSTDDPFSKGYQENKPVQFNQGRAFDLSKFQSKQLVTKPLWKWQDDEPKYLRFDGKIYTSDVKQDNRDPAEIADVTNLEDGYQYQIICNTVLKSELQRAYPGEDYVGRYFMVVCRKLPDRRYKQFFIEELELVAQE